MGIKVGVDSRSYLRIRIFDRDLPPKIGGTRTLGRKGKSASVLSTLNLHPGAKHPVWIARINLPRLLTGSSTSILTYIKGLSRGLNADIGRKDFFEMAYRKVLESQSLL